MDAHDIYKLETVDFGATGIKAKAQCISFLLGTMKGECPLDRDFGWEPDIDSQKDVSKAVNIGRIMEAINEQIEGAEIEEISCTNGGDIAAIAPRVKAVILVE